MLRSWRDQDSLLPNNSAILEGFKYPFLQQTPNPLYFMCKSILLPSSDNKTRDPVSGIQIPNTTNRKCRVYSIFEMIDPILDNKFPVKSSGILCSNFQNTKQLANKSCNGPSER